MSEYVGGPLGRERKYDLTLSVSMEEALLLANILRTHKFDGLNMEEYELVGGDVKHLMSEVALALKSKKPELDRLMAQSGMIIKKEG